MGSFNLGRIKGEKGDRGETGAKGETGARGEKGDKGDKGKDGLTPVFSIGDTVTLAAGEEAYVEINAENPASPVLSFHIPAGQNGKDALGNMLAEVYDPDGIGEDIYKYAKDLLDGCIKVTGGYLRGALKAAETQLAEGAVRNISARHSLPESGIEGDICIITSEDSSKTLGECHAGDILLVKEFGKEVPYLVVATDYHAENSVTLIRQNLSPCKGRFSSSKKFVYSMCETDIFLETMYKTMLSEEIQKNLLTVEVEAGAYRHCFLLAKADFTNINYLSTENNRIAKHEISGSADLYVTRTTDGQGNPVTISSAGKIITHSYQNETYYRPSIVLPAHIPVINVEHNSLPAVKIPDTKCGLYMYTKGSWKECANL